MFELIPCIVGAFVSAVLATRIRLTSRIVVAALAGMVVAVVSGEAAAWAPAVLLDSMLAAVSCVVVAVTRQRIAAAGLNRRAIAAVAPKA
jgi:uncharacterized membrane protein